MSSQNFLKQYNQLLKSSTLSSRVLKTMHSPMMDIIEKQNSSINKWNKLFDSLAVPSIATTAIRSQTVEAIERYTSAVKKIDKCLAPFLELHSFNYSNIKLLNSSTLKSISNINKSISRYQQLSSKIQGSQPNQDLVRFAEISNQMVASWSEYNLPDEIHHEVSNTLQETKSNNITPDRIIAIIAVIIALFTFIYDQLPDQAIEETNDKIQQLIDIENRQLELMEQQSQASHESTPE